MMEFHRILAPTDLSEPSFQAIKNAMKLAKDSGAELVLLRVLSDSENVAGASDEAQQNMDDLLRDYAPRELVTSTLVRHGDVTGEILKAAKAGNFDLIVMATHGTTGWREFVLGSVTGAVVRTAPCPVLTIGSAARK